MATFETVTVRELAKRLTANPSITIIDVRTPKEFEEKRISQARLLPLDTLTVSSLQSTAGNPLPDTIYFVCKSGGRSGKACELCMHLENLHLINVEGGTDGWIAAGHKALFGKETFWTNRNIIAFLLFFAVLGISALAILR